MEKGQAFRFDVVLFHLLGKGAGEVGLAVALHEIELGLLLVYHIVDSRGDGAFTVEGGGVICGECSAQVVLVHPV